MTIAENKAIASQVYEAINAKDLATLEKLFDPQINRHAAGELGFANAKNAVINAFTMFPNTRFIVEDILAEGDKVALRVSIHGIPTAEGRSQPIIMEIFRIENGRVAEIWGAGA